MGGAYPYMDLNAKYEKRCEAQIFLPEFNIRFIRLYDKNSESDFFFLHQKQNIFFSNVDISLPWIDSAFT
jgi:hypothetical protein